MSTFRIYLPLRLYSEVIEVPLYTTNEVTVGDGILLGRDPAVYLKGTQRNQDGRLEFLFVCTKGRLYTFFIDEGLTATLTTPFKIVYPVRLIDGDEIELPLLTYEEVTELEDLVGLTICPEELFDTAMSVNNPSGSHLEFFFRGRRLLPYKFFTGNKGLDKILIEGMGLGFRRS